MQSDDRALVQQTLAELTSILDGDELTRALDEFGWLDLLESEPADAVEALFSGQGRAGTWSSGFQDVVAAASDSGDTDTRQMTVVLPRPRAMASTGAAGAVDGLVIAPRVDTERVLAASGLEGSPRLWELPVETVEMTSVGGLDATLDLRRVTGSLDGATLISEGPDAASRWAAVVAAGRRAVAFQMCGAMETMIGLAVTHATDRCQFGRPIGTFQAVRHRLAESRVAFDGARCASTAAFDGVESELAALVTKVVVGRAAGVVSGHCQQVLAGVGFTADHPFHRFMFRATLMDRLLGSASELAPLLGRELLERGGAVRLVDL